MTELNDKNEWKNIFPNIYCFVFPSLCMSMTKANIYNCFLHFHFDCLQYGYNWRQNSLIHSFVFKILHE